MDKLKYLHDEISSLKINELPKSIQDLANIVGAPKAFKYAYKFGGVGVYFQAWNNDASAWEKDTKDLVRVVGIEHAKAFVVLFYGYNLKMPTCEILTKRLTGRQIAKERREFGTPNAVLARKFNLDERRLYQITSADRKARGLPRSRYAAKPERK
ncbi:MAG: hypothetical protein Q9M28_10125 [Mariprofundaceae bacterium]|nr:hypothetical protein [Mariprofundaceae bacterium]